MLKRMLAVTAVLALCACSQFSNRDEGADFGSGSDDLKQSPCACKEVPMRALNQYTG